MTSLSKTLQLIFITDKPDVARTTALAGVDIIMIDLEVNGKEERQGHLNTVISRHAPQDIDTVVAAVEGTNTSVMVRLNPIFDGTAAEIEDSIARGATRLMLPMFRGPCEVRQFLSLVRDRVPVTLLLETASAYARLRPILEVEGNYDLHIGLNDLHLELKLDFMFELLTGGVVEHVARLCHEADRPFGIGGVARLGSKAALPAEDILAAHIRLGSTGVILSRDWGNSLNEGNFSDHINSLRSFVANPPPIDPRDAVRAVEVIANSRRECKGSAT